MGAREYVAPRSLDAVLDTLAEFSCTILAGGTDVYPAHVGIPEPDCVLDLSLVKDLRGITHVEGGWRIGATTTWTDVVQSTLPSGFACVQEAALQIGAVQVQNAGTVAGNLCTASPAGDSIPALLALDAEVELLSLHGVRRLHLQDFIVGYRKTARARHELVTSIFVPDVAANSRSAFEKFGTRAYLVISLAMVAVSVRLDELGNVNDLCISVGACSPVAQRIKVLEQRLLRERSIGITTQPITSKDLSVLTPIDDIRCSAAYRFELVPVLIERALRRSGW